VSGSSSSGDYPFDEVGFSLHNRVASDCNADFVCSANINSMSNTVEGFRRNVDANGNADKAGKKRHEIAVGNADDLSTTGFGNCRQYTFKKDETYAISFKTPLVSSDENSYISLFQPGEDHASIGFRDKDGKTINDLKKDFMFFLPQTSQTSQDYISHYFEFSVPEKVSGACAVFTLAFYSPMAWLGTLKIQNFKIERKKEAYHFLRDGDDNYDDKYATTAKTNNADVQKKKDVKAFELHLVIDKKGEIGSTSPVKNSDGEFSNGFVIPTPNNGLRPPQPSPTPSS
jgi:hypothetical protein